MHTGIKAGAAAILLVYFAPRSLLPAAIAVGWFVAGWQHLLYAQPEYRESPASGRGRLALRLFVAGASGLVVGIALRPNHYDVGPAVLTAVFAAALVVISSTDLERRIIPNRLTYPAMLLAAGFCWAWPDRSVGDIWLGAAVAAGAAVALFALGILVGGAVGSSASAFGMGDVKLIVLIGLLVGWPAIQGAMLIGIIAAGIPAIVLLAMGGRRRVFSYGPYLALGGLAALLWPDRFV